LLLIQLRRVIDIDRARVRSALERVFAGHPLLVAAVPHRRNFPARNRDFLGSNSCLRAETCCNIWSRHENAYRQSCR
jgi:hypothetical protein